MIFVKKSRLFFTAFCCTFLVWMLYIGKRTSLKPKSLTNKKCIYSNEEGHMLPLIFIGGHMRSGTTLMRAMLDAHPDIRCGPETGVIPLILKAAREVYEDRLKVLEGNGLLEKSKSSNMTIVEDVFSQFILNMILQLERRPTKYYCNKEPLNMYYLKYLEKFFPNSKFILMVRDPRAVVRSRLRHQYNLEIMTPNIYKTYLSEWNDLNTEMVSQCINSTRCLLQYYEQLVLQPVKETKKIFQFFEIPWNEEVLHHEKHMNETKLNPIELSSDQVKNAIYLEALTDWFGTVPISSKELDNIAPIMRVLGYDPYDNEPYYGEPDDFVLKKGIWKKSDKET